MRSWTNSGKLLISFFKVLLQLNPSICLTFCTVIASRRRQPTAAQGRKDDGAAGSSAGTSLFDEKQRRGKGGRAQKDGQLTTAQLLELEAEHEREAVQHYERVKKLWSEMLAGNPEATREWMRAAESLIDPFEETRALFRTTKVSPSVKLVTHAAYNICRMATEASFPSTEGANNKALRMKTVWPPGCSLN